MSLLMCLICLGFLLVCVNVFISVLWPVPCTFRRSVDESADNHLSVVVPKLTDITNGIEVAIMNRYAIEE
jgi:hypothetical protein